MDTPNSETQTDAGRAGRCTGVASGPSSAVWADLWQVIPVSLVEWIKEAGRVASAGQGGS